MNRRAVFVDAGYLMSQVGRILSDGRPVKRSRLVIDEATEVVGRIIKQAELLMGPRELLRVYWYDGARNGQLTPEHKAVVAVDDVQLRLGSVNAAGRQKGVDSRIVTDLIDLAQKHAIADAVLLSGDADLAVGVEIAQRSGVRVGLLGIVGTSKEGCVPVPHAQSEELIFIADRHRLIGDDATFVKLFHLQAAPVAPVDHRSASNVPSAEGGSKPGEVLPQSSTSEQPLALDLKSAVRSFLESLPSQPQPADLVPTIPSELDRELLFRLKKHLGRLLEEKEKRLAREALRTMVKQRAAQT